MLWKPDPRLESMVRHDLCSSFLDTFSAPSSPLKRFEVFPYTFSAPGIDNADEKGRDDRTRDAACLDRAGRSGRSGVLSSLQ
jgi:hypothetical protein